MPKLLTLDKEDNVMVYVCLYSHRSHIVIDLLTCDACPISLLAKNSAPSRDTTCASKNLKPEIMFWESSIPTYGLSKILQVSCRRCNKAIKISSKSVTSFRVKENWALYVLVMAKNKSDRLHNKGCYHKGQCNMIFFCIKLLSI